MTKFFGTDGVRGIANSELTPELAFKLGRFGGYVLTKHANERPKVLIGRDTRISGQMLEGALVAGLLSIGAEAMRLGVITTPGVAYLTKALGAQAGVMISASHNPVEDNGIKFFGTTVLNCRMTRKRKSKNCSIKTRMTCRGRSGKISALSATTLKVARNTCSS